MSRVNPNQNRKLIPQSQGNNPGRSISSRPSSLSGLAQNNLNSAQALQSHKRQSSKVTQIQSQGYKANQGGYTSDAQGRRNIQKGLLQQSSSQRHLGQNPGNILPELPQAQNFQNNKLSAEQFTTAQKAINQAVLEYLLKNGLMRTVDCLHDELTILKQQGGLQNNFTIDENTGIAHLLSAFESGKREHFFISWNRFVPIGLRSTDIKCQKLEFYLHIYFAIYPALPDSGQSQRDLQRELNAFKYFLDTKGSELSKTSEFLPYYALPYVQSPQEHSHFSNLCTRKWSQGLKNELIDWLKNNLPKSQHPQLFNWFASFRRRQEIIPPGSSLALAGAGLEQVEMEDLKEKYLILQKHYVMLQKKEQYAKSTLIQSQSKWTSFAREIVNIAKELLFSLEARSVTATINKISLIPIRQKLGNYEAFLNNNVENLASEHGINLNTKPTFIQQAIQQLQSGQPESDYQNQVEQQMNNSFDEDIVPLQKQLQHRFQEGQPNRPYPPNEQQQEQHQQQALQILNYKIIKQFLLNSNENVKISATLQALRWRLTKTRKKKTLRQVILTYMHFDILDCGNKQPGVIDKLLQSQDRRVLEYTMSFVNALGNECLGRSYLLQKQDLVDNLVHILRDEQGDTHLRQNALGALQKFSLRRRPQTIMIQLDLIKWISAILRNEAEQLTDYSIEYATALLMNLSLRDAGKDKCEESDIKLLNVLNDLVEHENLQVRTYVNGTLYSIFTRKKLREEAKELGMPEVLQYLMEQSDEQFKRQIQYILEQLNMNLETQAQDGNEDGVKSINANEGEDDLDDEEEDDEDDYDEEELFDAEDEELNDMIVEQGGLIGEKLLEAEFVADDQEAEKQQRIIYDLLEKDQKQRANINRNNISATGGGIPMNSMSPYRVSASRNDGRPPTRPITPIKSSQQARYPNATASNTSQITNSVIGHPDDSNFLSRPNLALHQQQSMFDPPRQGLARNINLAPSYENEEIDRNLPSELRHRPKIPRTPADGAARRVIQNQNNQNNQEQVVLIPKIKGEPVVEESKIEEHKVGFVSREKIVRTPPDDQNVFFEQKFVDLDDERLSPGKKQIGKPPNPDLPVRSSQNQIQNLPLRQQLIYQQQQNQRGNQQISYSDAAAIGSTVGGVGQKKVGKGIQMEFRPNQ